MVALIEIAMIDVADAQPQGVMPTCESTRAVTVHDFVGIEGAGAVYVAVSPDGLSLRRLLCVARSLNRTHPAWSKVSVLMFESEEAARSWTPIQNPSPGSLRATYNIDRPSRAESLTLHLLTDNDPAAHLDSTVDMASSRTVRCRFEVARRCLLSMDSPAFPIESPDVPAGAVTIVATINQSGRIANMSALRSSAPSGATKSLTEAVIRHLSTWRFDPSSSSSPIEVVYRYVIDPDIIVPVIELASAQQVTIRANPGITRQDLERIQRRGRGRPTEAR